MSIQIYLLGQFKCIAREESLELKSRPAQTLFAYLVLNAGMVHRREKLAALLWPEANEINARSYLRQALWRIHKAFDSACLDWQNYLHSSELEIIFIDQSDYWLDVDKFLSTEITNSADELISILQLYRGELLPGFYEEWVVSCRERILTAYHQKMHVLLDTLNHAQRWDDTVAWAEQWIRYGYAPEPAFRFLMQTYAALGNLSMVSATYQRCVLSLERELGLLPSPETQHLYEKCRLGEQPTLERPSLPQPPTILYDKYLENFPQQRERPVFVARNRELAQLKAFLDLATNSQGRVIFVTGEAGCGKTALLQEFSRRALEAYPDLVVASGNCNAYSGIGDPYLPFREILSMLTGDFEARCAAGAMTIEQARRLWQIFPLVAQTITEDASDLIDTFISHTAFHKRVRGFLPNEENWLQRLEQWAERKQSGFAVSVAQQHDLFDQFTRLLHILSHHVLLVIWVDDLQWADRGSISLLFHLGRRLACSRILVIASYRPEDVAIGRDGERHPLDPVANELQRDFGDITINLGQTENLNFIQAFLDSEPNKLGVEFRQMLYCQTAGHPLFTIELLRGLQEHGDLVKDQYGCWVEAATLNWEMLPARIEAVLAERIGRLPESLKSILSVASVEGEQFTAEVIARVLSLEESQVQSLLSSELDRRHRLVTAQSIQQTENHLLSLYRFRHILFQKYLYNNQDEVERVHLHDRIGVSLELFYRDFEQYAEIIPQLALHFQKARRTEKAIHYSQLAGERALELSAYQEAINHLTTALNLLMTLPPNHKRSQQELTLQSALGLAFKPFISNPAGEKTLLRALELCHQVGTPTQLCRVLGELSTYPYVRAEYIAAFDLAVESLELAEQIGDPLMLAINRWHLGFIHFGLGEFDAARQLFLQVISFYNPPEHHRLFIRKRGVDAGISSMAYDACCLWCLGYPDQALARSRQSLVLAQDLAHNFTLADALCYAGCVLDMFRGDSQSLRKQAKELTIVLEKLGFSSFRGTGMCFLGNAMVQLGHLQEGMALVQQGDTVRDSVQAHCSTSIIYGTLAEALMKSGNLTTASDMLSTTMDFVVQSNENFYLPELYRIQASLNLQNGDLQSTQRCLHQAIQVARQQQSRSWELRASIDLAYLWQQQHRIAEARTMLTQIYNWFTEGFDTPDLLAAQQLLQELLKISPPYHKY